jgi:hypothetical protein
VTFSNYYLPWTLGKSNFGPGISWARRLAASQHQALTFVMSTKNHLDERLKRDSVVTARSGFASQDAFVALLHPSVKEVARFYHDRHRGGFLVVEYGARSMAGWAAVHGAVDLTTREVVRDDRPGDVIAVHEHIAHVGYNGWTSAPGSHSIKSDLQQLHEAGWLDESGKDFLIASMVAERSWESLRELRGLADKVSPRADLAV